MFWKIFIKTTILNSFWFEDTVIIIQSVRQKQCHSKFYLFTVLSCLVVLYWVYYEG